VGEIVITFVVDTM